MKTWKGVREIFIEPRICGVYLICVDTDHGMRFYSGHTNNPVKRFAEHHQLFVEGLGYRNMRMLLLCEAKKESKRVESEKCFITAGRRLHLPLLNEPVSHPYTEYDFLKSERLYEEPCANSV